MLSDGHLKDVSYLQGKYKKIHKNNMLTIKPRIIKCSDGRGRNCICQQTLLAFTALQVVESVPELQ